MEPGGGRKDIVEPLVQRAGGAGKERTHQPQDKKDGVKARIGAEPLQAGRFSPDRGKAVWYHAGAAEKRHKDKSGSGRGIPFQRHPLLPGLRQADDPAQDFP